MDETNQDQHAVHSVTPKKRGRPTKAAPVAVVAESAEPFVMELSSVCVGQYVGECVRFDVSPAQSLANRIYRGQSPDLLMPDRLARVKAGLEDQGMSMEGVVL